MNQQASDVLVEHIGGLLSRHDSCLVQFSGGVDSSLVLCAAVEAARRGGHPDPIPLTYRFPGLSRTDESDYQEHVVRSLGLATWRIEELTDEHDLVGPAALETLAETGMVFPPTLVAKSATLARLDAPLVLSGEGGDAIFGARRVTSVRLTARHLFHRDWSKARRFARELPRDLGPKSVRRRLLTEDFRTTYGLEWIREPHRTRLLEDSVAEDADEPLDPRRFLEHHLSTPIIWVHRHNARAIRRRFGVTLETPLFAPEFLVALQAQVPWHHWTNRSEIMQRYFADLLPERIRHRESKAEFTDVYFNGPSRSFVARWDGRGLPDTVDADWLQRHWRHAPRIHAGTTMLLQMAALAEAHGA